MNPGVFAPPFAGQLYPAPQFVSPPAPWQAPNQGSGIRSQGAEFAGQPASWQTPNPVRLPSPPAQRPLLARAKGLDDPLPAPVPAPLAMPSPEQLGVVRAKAAAHDGVNWTDARRRLDRLGATCFHLEKLSPSGYRFTCLLPTTQPGRTHHVEAVAATEPEAVRLTLEKSEEWAGAR